MIYFIYIYPVVLYISLIFFFSRFVIPHLEFKDEKLPEKLPAGMREKINELKIKSKTAEDFLKLAYDYLGDKYYSGRWQTLLKFYNNFYSLDQAWKKSGHLPCTINNYILKIFLVKSGFFKENDIRRRHVFANFLIHQYLQVKVNGKWMNVDAGEKQRGLPLGKHLFLFG